MPDLDLVTWNCQKVVAATNGIDYLVSQSFDAIMLQEVPKSLRDRWGTNTTVIEGAYTVICPKGDNQTSSSACRSYLLLKTSAFSRIQRFSINVPSGQSQAQRYSASAKVTISGSELRIVSAHMTSGGGGPSNTDDIVSALIDGGDDSAFIIGADFNGPMGQYTGTLFLPTGGTQQSTNNPIDGFTSENGEDFTFTVNQRQISQHPSFTLNPAGQPLGCYFNGTRVSDHIPVQMKIPYQT